MFLLIGCNMQGKNRNVSARSPYSRLRSQKIDSQFRFFLIPALEAALAGTCTPVLLRESRSLDQLNL